MDEMRWCEYPNASVLEAFALNEAMIITRQESRDFDTVHLWQGSGSLVVLPKCPVLNESEIHSYCRSKRISVTRGPGGRRVLVCGPGILDFSFVVESQVSSSEDLMNEVNNLVEALVETITSTLSTHRIDIADEYLLLDNRAIGAVCTYYYFDYMLLYGALIVDDRLGLAALAFQESQWTTASLTDFADRDSTCRGIMESAFRCIPEALGVKLTRNRPNSREVELTNALCKWKYTNKDWIRNSVAPLALGRVLLETYVAYPPTKRCRELIGLRESLANDLHNKVELRVWMRGKGLLPWLKGSPPGLVPSAGIVQASKKHIVPAVVIDGAIQWQAVVPVYDYVKHKLVKAYTKKFGDTAG